MPTSTELTQLVSGDPNTLFLAIKSFDKLLPEMKSHIFPHAEHHEGDGGAGTVSTYGLHEDLAAGGPTKYTTVMEVFDEATCTYIIDVQGDSRYTHVKINGKLSPGPNSGTTLFKWFADYSPVNEDTPPPEHLLAVIPHMFQDLADHLQGPSSGISMPTGPESQALSQLVKGDPDALFLAIKNFNELLPQMKPHIFPHAEHHEGDGGEGTVSTYGLHESCMSFSPCFAIQQYQPLGSFTHRLISIII
ncbi:hypothetical protein KC19_7G126200 [Ceratodon purpureus]|uniref:Bet v I/Major latex protein domain-containing protein n=1 Tax=Ceratodon purpureus TaxID=3225 RepID=A0A8T0H5Q9_CERPU|nr:hypothetical protein KC19_7G126200 [Ceratodon purpureus]